MILRIIGLILFLTAVQLPVRLPATEMRARSILVLDQSESRGPFHDQIFYGLRSTVNADTRSHTTIYEENLDLTRFNGAAYEESLRQQLKEKYRDRPIGVVVAVGTATLELVLRWREELWPGVPVVFALVNEMDFARLKLPPDATGGIVRIALADSIKAARAVVPDLDSVVFVGAPWDRRVIFRNWKDEIPAATAGLKVIEISGATMAETRKRVEALPARSVILFSAMYSDGEGTFYPPAAALKPIFNWRQMRRWDVSESSMPQDSEIRFREPGLWENYRWQGTFVGAVLLIQTGLISVLLHERKKRNAAEFESQHRMTELAHANRQATAGELSSSIAHELSQPLGAILTNAETAELILDSPSPNLSEIKEILADIRRDDQRASGVIHRLRSFLKRTPFETKDIDLNDTMREVFDFLSVQASSRNVALQLQASPEALHVKGDPVQLQQVILNLMVNSMDAMAAMPNDRTVVGRTEMNGGSSAVISIFDSGPGIPPHRLNEVFDPVLYDQAARHGHRALHCAHDRTGPQGADLGRERGRRRCRISSFVTALSNLGDTPVPGVVHVVDDDASFRTAIERRLKKAGYEVATYPSAQHLLDHLPDQSGPGCILLDVRIPGLSGPELQGRLSELGSALPIVFLTGYADVPTTVQAIKAGADDFLTKPVSSDQLLRTIQRAMAHHQAMRDTKSKLDIVRAHIASLTPREREVFELVVRGKTNKHVAHELGATERTIKAHRHRVMEKMQVQSLAELVSLAERVGILDASSSGMAEKANLK
jgi:FixJ family two-component response regulator/signal transduction histidine kinase